MAGTTKMVTFSMPPAMEEQLGQVADEEGRTVSEPLREGFRLYPEEREWLRQERMQMRRSRQPGWVSLTQVSWRHAAAESPGA